MSYKNLAFLLTLFCLISTTYGQKQHTDPDYLISIHTEYGKYTVFGQVVSGFEVIDMIVSQTTSQNDRPIKNIRITVEVEEVNRPDIEKFYNFTYK